MNKINTFQTPKVEIQKKDAYKAKKYNSLMDRGNKFSKNKNKNYNTDIFKEDINLYKREMYNNYNDYMNTYSLDSQEDDKSKVIKKYQSLEDHDYIIDYEDNKNRTKNKIKTYLEKEDFYINNNIRNKKRNSKNKKKVFYNNLLNEDGNYNKYNSFSNMLKVKKMISSPVLDSNIKKNIKEKHYNQISKNFIDMNKDSDSYENMNNDIKGKINNKNYTNIVNKEDEMLNYEIEKLKKEIVAMQANNNILLNKLNEEKNKNSSLIAFNKNENFPSDEELQNILTDMASYLQVNSFEDIVPKLKEMIQYLNVNLYEKNDKNNIRNEFISKLKELYLTLNDKKDKNDTITIKVLWRWIKHLINSYKSLLIEKEKKDEILKNMEKKESYYKECCEELMNKYNMKNLEQLNKFIEELIKKNNMNKRRVEQLKKILVDDNKPQSKSDKNLKIDFNKMKDEDIKYKRDY